jgi:hypothetical protein
MEKFTRRASFAALLAVPAALALTPQASAEVQSVTGQMIDLGGFETKQSRQNYTGIHARACALEGFAQGVLTSDGKVYQIVGDYAANANAKLLPFYLVSSVTVTGEIAEKDGRMTIMATDIKAKQ